MAHTTALDLIRAVEGLKQALQLTPRAPLDEAAVRSAARRSGVPVVALRAARDLRNAVGHLSPDDPEPSSRQLAAAVVVLEQAAAGVAAPTAPQPLTSRPVVGDGNPTKAAVLEITRLRTVLRAAPPAVVAQVAARMREDLVAEGLPWPAADALSAPAVVSRWIEVQRDRLAGADERDAALVARRARACRDAASAGRRI